MIIKYFKTEDGRPFYGYSLKDNDDRKNKSSIQFSPGLVYSPDLSNVKHIEITEEEYNSIVNSILKIFN